ncbi:MAG TPA: hypothetical protein VF519_18640 [Mycobacteriales bacterium]|jgi:hypothetical protein
MTRRLTLKKDSLAPLTTDELGVVGGAAQASALTCFTCLGDCVVVGEYSVILVTECCSGLPTFPCPRG